MKQALFFAAVLAFNAGATAQKESGSVPDAPTRILEQTELHCRLEGLKVDRKRQGNETDVNISFLLTQKPSVYFHYYDARKKALVFDFYDTRLGESPLDSIHEAPITRSYVEYSRTDLNAAVPGLKADVRDRVRVLLFTPDSLSYSMQEDESVITLSYKRSNSPAAPVKSGGDPFKWQLALVLVLSALAGFGLYTLLL